MKLKKLLAGALASLVAISAMSVATLTVGAAGTSIAMVNPSDEVISNVEMEAWGSQWVKSYDAALTTADLSTLQVEFKITTSGEYDANNNIAFKLYNLKKDGEDVEDIEVPGVADQKDYTITLDLSLISLDEYGGLGFNSQAGHLPVTLVSVTIVDKGSSEPIPPANTDDTTPADPTPGASSGNTNNDNKNPSTGILFAVLPVVLAGSALTGASVLKKRK